VRSRLTPIVAGMVTLAMVTFGQLCAFSTVMAPVQSEAESVAVESTPEAEHHGATCDPRECGGESEDGDQGCPSGASSCCSTWGPPSARPSVSPPESISFAPSDLCLVVSQNQSVEERAMEVAFCELARPPGHPTDAHLASSLSRRGPPART
jgi:hypothetical protein